MDDEEQASLDCAWAHQSECERREWEEFSQWFDRVLDETVGRAQPEES
jgi:hypothetical protein